MRLFIALNFPAQLRESLHAVVGPLRVAAPTARWTRPEKLHLTLQFLGERSDEIVASLAAVLDAVAAQYRAIPRRWLRPSTSAWSQSRARST